MQSAVDFLRAAAEKRGARLIVTLASCQEAAELFGAGLREIEIEALKNGLCPTRYEKNLGTIGIKGQISLLSSKAVIVGCGGLGGWIAEILARAGVGKLILADGDVFGENNLNRQLFATEANLGCSKAEAAVRRVKEINSAVTASAYNLYVNRTNGTKIIAGSDVVVDALDSDESRREIFDLCSNINIPFVHGAVGGFFGRAAVFRAGDTPVWDFMRPYDHARDDPGMPPFMPPFIAAVEAAEAVKIMANLDGRLEGTLLWFDMRVDSLQKITLGKLDNKSAKDNFGTRFDTAQVMD